MEGLAALSHANIYFMTAENNIDKTQLPRSSWYETRYDIYSK